MIFCVEDDSNIRELVIYTLETTGFKARGFEGWKGIFRSAGTGDTGIDLIRHYASGNGWAGAFKQIKSVTEEP